MTVVAMVAHPFVRLLSATTHYFLRLLRVRVNDEAVMTTEEIEESLAEGLGAGVIEVHEHQMVRNVFALDTRSLGSIMLPRADIHWLRLLTRSTKPCKSACAGALLVPVCKGGLDNIVGVLHVSECCASGMSRTAGCGRRSCHSRSLRPRDLNGHGAVAAIPCLGDAHGLRGG